MNEFSEKDWKLFRRKIAVWQNAYINKLNKEYMEILNSNETPAEKFWKLEKRINENKKDGYISKTVNNCVYCTRICTVNVM